MRVGPGGPTLSRIRYLVTVKAELLDAEPAGVATRIGPVFAPFGTTARMLASLTIVKLADLPLNVTDVAVPRAAPEIVTVVPARPLGGEKPEMVGADGGGDVVVTVKLAVLVAVPAGVVTVIV